MPCFLSLQAYSLFDDIADGCLTYIKYSFLSFPPPPP